MNKKSEIEDPFTENPSSSKEGKKYLIMNHKILLEGELIQEVEEGDLLITRSDSKNYRVVKKGVQIVNQLNILVNNYNYEIALSILKENDQVEDIGIMKKECQRLEIDFPSIKALIISDNKNYKGINFSNPKIIKDRHHGITVVGYDKELPNKECERNALCSFLGISDTNKNNHIIFDYRPNIINSAGFEGFKTFLIGKLSLAEAINEVYEKEACFKSYQTLELYCKQILDIPDKFWDAMDDINKYYFLVKNNFLSESYKFLNIDFKQYLSEKTQIERHKRSPHPSTEIFWYEFPSRHLEWLQEKKRVRYPDLVNLPIFEPNEFGRLESEVFGEIIRRDKDFENTGKPRKSGSSFSLGFFIEKSTNNEWVGKADQSENIEKSEAMAIKEKIANDIYGYFGVNIAKNEVSFQKFCFTGIENETEFERVHLMSKMLINFMSYEDIYRENKLFFDCRTPTNGGFIPFGKIFKREKGLGNILAVAALINDIDVIGAQGGNIGVIEDNKGYLTTYKIDSGEAFNTNLSLQKKKHIKVKSIDINGDSYLPFIILPPNTKKEFLFTLHHIARCKESIFEGFFKRKGGHKFIQFFQLTIKELTDILLKRQNQLIEEYTEELKETKNEYESWIKTYFRIDNKIANLILEQLYFFIPPDLEVNKERIPINKILLDDFLNPENQDKVVLLKGDSGAGKTLSMIFIHESLLERKRLNSREPMPIYIDLKKFNTETVKDCVLISLQTIYHMSMDDLNKELVVLLLDGYDEICGGFKENLYICQKLYEWPNVKMIISCRTQYLSDGYISWFSPLNKNVFKEYFIMSFNEEQIDKYLENYVKLGDRPFTLSEYRTKIKEINSLRDIINNPFTLRLITDALEYIIKYENEVNKFAIFECFMSYWFARQEYRLRESDGSNINKKNNKELFESFAVKMALNLHVSKKVEVTMNEIDNNLKKYFPDEIQYTRARSGCPIQKIGENFSFIHKSFLEYFSSLVIIEELCSKEINREIILAPKHMGYDPATVIFIKERIALYPDLKKTLYDLILQSKYSKDKYQIGKAANAITILNLIGENFQGINFQDIQIPNAILSFGIFDNTNFKGSDLSRVNFEGSWLRNANFEEAKLTRLKLGEYPHKKLTNKIMSCTYSSCGNLLFIATGNIIKCYKSDDLSWVKDLIGHTDEVTCLVSLRCNYVCSGSKDTSVKIWDSKLLELICTSFLHTDIISCLAYSENLIVSGSFDKSIHIWDYTEFYSKSVFFNKSKIRSIAISPHGELVISGDYENVINVWNVKSGECVKSLLGNPDVVVSINFSSDGKLFASGSGNDIKLWDAYSFNEISTLSEHTNSICCVLFNHDNTILASSSEDKTIKLWDPVTGKTIKTISGNSGKIRSFSFSLNGNQIVSVNDDNTFKLWEIDSEILSKPSHGHKSCVYSITISKDGTLIASGSHDNNVNLWNSLNGQILQTFTGHNYWINHVTFSNNDKFIASASSDKKIKIWDVSSNKIEPKTFNGHVDCVHSVAFNHDDTQLVSGGNDKMLIIWDIENREIIRIIKEGFGCVYGIFLSPEMEYTIYSFSRNFDNLNIHWDEDIDKEKKTKASHSMSFNSFAYDRSRFALANGNDCLLKWDINSKKFIKSETFKGVVILDSVNLRIIFQLSIELLGPEIMGIISIIFSPDGNSIGIGCQDKTFRVWDINSNVCVGIFRNSSTITSIFWRVITNEHYLGIGDAGHSVKLFKIKKSEYILVWVSPQLILNAGNLNLKKAKEISKYNMKLLKQRGANITCCKSISSQEKINISTFNSNDNSVVSDDILKNKSSTNCNIY